MPQWINRSHTYQHPWERVTNAFWHKYPNPLSPHVLSIDVLDRWIDEEGNLHTVRLMTCKDRAVPEWISNVVGGKNYAYVIERSMINLNEKQLVMKSKNISYESLISVEETCRYTVDKENTEHTLFSQEAKISVPIWGLAARKVENLTLENFHKNAKKGLQAMEHICEKIKNNTYLDIFSTTSNNTESTTTTNQKE
ncbi:hypothetical protein ABK040_006722 [Willaertia magna]